MILTPKSKTSERSEALNATATDEIRQLRDAVAGVLKRSDRDVLPSPDPDWRAGWPALAELGITALCASEDRGGFGFRIDVAAAVARELGAALHGSPFAGIVASSVALAASDDPRAGAVLDAVVSGSSICAYGQVDPGTSTARAVDGAEVADALVLKDGGATFLLDDRAQWSEEGDPYRFDVSRVCSDLSIDASTAAHLPARPTAPLVHSLLLAADALGGVERGLARTVAYASDRQAFGRPIGGFQAVQHRLADHAVRVRGMSLLVDAAADALAARADDAGRRVLLASASVSGGAVHVLHDLVQLTGGIGFTWEYGLHFFERRAQHDARLAGGVRRARHLLAATEGWTDAG